MITRAHQTGQHGFTLIEVMVAMMVIALGIGALLSTLTNSANLVNQLRDRSFAEWIAFNQISDARLSSTPPSVGTTSGEVDYAGTRWLWRQEVVDPGAAGMLRINVSVAHAGPKAAKAAESGENFPVVSSAYGFFGTEVGTHTGGMDPTWSQQAPPRNPGSPSP